MAATMQKICTVRRILLTLKVNGIIKGSVISEHRTKTETTEPPEIEVKGRETPSKEEATPIFSSVS